MCGRFTLSADPEELRAAFPDFKFPAKYAPRYNIAPTQPIAAVPNDGRNAVDFFVWGLIPSWAKDPAIGSRLINARAETLGEKPSFRSAYQRRRCLILADGFFEWQASAGGKTKTPHFISRRDRKPFAFAGLWELWSAPDGSEVKSATIITTEPNALIGKLHNRMPVILAEDSWERWIDPAERKPADLNDLLKAYPAELMAYFPVSKLVNSPANDIPAVLEPARDLNP